MTLKKSCVVGAIAGAGAAYCAWVWYNGRNHKRRTLQADEYVPLKLVRRQDLTHDTRLLRFELPSAEHVLGLPPGQHVSVRSRGTPGASDSAAAKTVSRPYTPVSGDDLAGFVDLVVKVYLPGVHPRFPLGGKMSARFEALRIGQTMDFRGPKGHIEYVGGGTFRVAKGYRSPPAGTGLSSTTTKWSRSTAERLVRGVRIGMLCGGSGVTPMLRLVEWSHRHEAMSEICWSMLFANQSPQDILCREQLERVEAVWPQGFKLWYTVDRVDDKAGNGDSWQYDRGFINKEMIAARLPPPAADTVILLCGPPPMIERACLPALRTLGYTDDNILIF